MVQYMQGLATSLGQAPLPPAVFAAPSFVRDATPPPSAASNDGPLMQDLSPPQPPPWAQYRPPLQQLQGSPYQHQHSSPYSQQPYASPPCQQPPRPPPSL
ncbi:unnamed protein product [Urochloa humidicola]